MDIFGKKKIKQLENEVLEGNRTIYELQVKISKLSRSSNERNNQQRTFKIYTQKERSYEIKANHFDHNMNGYYFYDTEPSRGSDSFEFYKTNLIAHVPDREVLRVEEQPAE